MHKLLAGLALLGVAIIATPVFAFTSPGHPSGHINDFPYALSPDARATLEAELVAFEASTTNQIAVAIVPSMNGDYIEDYSARLFKEWGIGTKQHDNGVLLVLALAEHKLRIEVGYGLEGALPDSVAQRILNADMTPHLKAGDYDGAVTLAVRDIEAATVGEYVSAPLSVPRTDWWQLVWNNGATILFIVLFVLQWLASVLARSRSWWAGGVVGALGGLLVGTSIPLVLTTTLGLAVAFMLLGLLFDYIVSNTYKSSVQSGSTPPWWIGGGYGGGSSSGGGFGGFGGGGSGGGGASGGW